MATSMQQKDENVLVKFPALVTTLVVALKLITPIYSTHKVIMEEDTLDRDLMQ